MARQPAVEINIPFTVTYDALVHVPDFVRQPVKVLNLAVALLARDVLVNMPLMVEEDVLGQVVDLAPRSRGVCVEIFVFFLNPRVSLNYVVVAVQTKFHRRQSWKIGVGHVWVAILALNLFDTTVDVVAERYGLFRASIRTITIKEIDKQNNCDARKQGKQQRPPIAFQRWQESCISGSLISH